MLKNPITTEHQNLVGHNVQSSVDFAEQIRRHREEILGKKLGRVVGRISVPALPSEFGQENLENWMKYNLHPIYLPDLVITEDFSAGHWVKLNPWFYSKIREGGIKQDSLNLEAGWYLADFSVGVDYANGTQVFPDDPLTSIISRLRQERKIGNHEKTPSGSRFAITNDEWREIVCPAIAKEIGVKPEQVRLERVVEFNAIGNLYDVNRGKFAIWEWFTDHFRDSDRLYGGDRKHGGLADVYHYPSNHRVDFLAGRPLVSFA